MAQLGDAESRIRQVMDDSGRNNQIKLFIRGELSNVTLQELQILELVFFGKLTAYIQSGVGNIQTGELRLAIGFCNSRQTMTGSAARIQNFPASQVLPRKQEPENAHHISQ